VSEKKREREREREREGENSRIHGMLTDPHAIPHGVPCEFDEGSDGSVDLAC